MTAFASTLIVLGCLGVTLAPWLGGWWVAAPTKVAASSGFLLLAWIRGASQSRFGQLILAGLVLSWFGDAFLLAQGEVFFLAGLGAFLLAHLCYGAAFAVHGVSMPAVALAAVPVFAAAFAVVHWLSPGIPAAMTIPVWAYATVISAMLSLALGAWRAGAVLLVPLGAALFFVSDLAVAMGQFLDTDFHHGLWGLPLYYAGQTLLALSVGVALKASA